MSRRIKWSLLGISDHQGVINVGGRIGAAGGPRAFRSAMTRLSGRLPIFEELKDFGDVRPASSDIQATHQKATEAVHRAHQATGLSVIVGGGHDHGFSHLAGVSQALGSGKRLGCINIDAHLDVRKPEPLITSGSPFFLALETKVLSPERLIEFGIQSHSNGPALWDYVESKKVEVVGFEKLRHGGAVSHFEAALKKLSTCCDAIVVSFDLDAIAAAFAPGVSAPATEGLTSSEAVHMMECAGAFDNVCSLGIFELNPEHDRDEMTAKLASVLAYHFVSARLTRLGS